MRFLISLLIMSVPHMVYAAEPATGVGTSDRTPQPIAQTGGVSLPASGEMLDERIEDVKNEVLNLNRDLFILEEQLLFPSNTQFAIYLSVDVGEYFEFESIRVLLDNKPVASYLYTERESKALLRGGVHRLYLGNMTSGKHELVAYYTGKGPNGRDFKRAVEKTINKGMGPRYIELRIADDPLNKQVNFLVREWKN